MKKFLITMMGLLVVLSCGQKPASSSDDDEEDVDDVGTEEVETTKPLELKTYTFSDTVGMAHTDISIEFPVKGEKKLVHAIRRYLAERIELESDEVELRDGQGMTDYYGRQIMNRMEELAAGYEDDDYVDEVYHDWSFSKFYEDDKVVTFLAFTSLYEGGIHGISHQEGLTFFKDRGQLFGFDMMKNTDSEEFVDLLCEGLSKYFSPKDGELIDDEALNEELISVEGLENIPLPVAHPYITDKGVHIIYQPYEVSYYAAGMPEFDIPLKKIRPFLTKKAKQLLDLE